MTHELTFRPIRDRRDPLLIPWLQLYELAFPPDQRQLVCSQLELLSAVEQGIAPDVVLLAVLHEGEFVGMAQYCLAPESNAGYLIFLATVEERRGKGLGAQIYAEVRRHLSEMDASCIVLEVEIPQIAPDSSLAARRIGFYERRGARLLGGVHYSCQVGPHQPLVSAHVMIDPLDRDLSPEDAFSEAREVLGEDLERIGTLHWA